MISKTLHQIWLGDKPEHIAQSMQRTKQLFESNDWEYIEWSLSKLFEHKMLTKSLAKRVMSTVHMSNALKFALLADIARYNIIYTYGGFYADADTEFVKIIPQSLLESKFVCGYGDEFYKYSQKLLINGVFGSIKQNLVTKVLHKTALSNVSSELLYSFKPWLITGPFMFTQIVEYYAKMLDSITILPVIYLCPFSQKDYVNLNKLTSDTICYTYWNHKRKDL